MSNNRPLLKCGKPDVLGVMQNAGALQQFEVNGTKLSVEGPEGGVVSFQCSHKLAQNNRKYFCKDPCLPEHILAEVRPGTVTGSDKITLWDARDGALNITLSNLSTSDSGTYWCGVDRLVLDTFTRVDLRVKEVKLGTYHTKITFCQKSMLNRTHKHTAVYSSYFILSYSDPNLYQILKAGKYNETLCIFSSQSIASTQAYFSAQYK
uniref:Immunoglobulin domain-containing protein n=1 Tax=Neogobius melanostomus TaxID=47308 RepID=A0A8C6SMZ5_9GOBI